MKVILRKFIPHVGRAGEVRDVADGYGRNFLLAKGLAELATPARIAEVKRHEDGELAAKSEGQQQLATRLRGIGGKEFVLRAKASPQGTLFSSVTATDVSDILSQKGFAIPSSVIRLERPLKHVGVHDVTLGDGRGETALVRIVIAAE